MFLSEEVCLFCKDAEVKGNQLLYIFLNGKLVSCRGDLPVKHVKTFPMHCPSHFMFNHVVLHTGHNVWKECIFSHGFQPA